MQDSENPRAVANVACERQESADLRPPLAGGASLVFLHIRKTAGLTVRNILANRFHVSQVLTEWHEVPQRDCEPNQYAFVTGHVTPVDLQRFASPPRVLVILRRPVERALSAYDFYRGHSPEMLQYFRRVWPAELFASREEFHAAAQGLSLREFLHRHESIARAWLENVQTRTLAGCPDGFAPPPGDLLGPAVGFLAGCEFVGVTERLSEVLGRVARAMDWSEIGELPRVNRTAVRSQVSEIDPAAREILADWNRLDEQLYQRAGILAAERERGSLQMETARPPASGGLPAAAEFTFDQPIHGRGWHGRERFDERWICWTGVERVATLNLRLETDGPHFFEGTLASYLEQDVLEGLEIELNGVPLDLERRVTTEGVRLAGTIASIRREGRERSRPGVVQLCFRVPRLLRPCDVDPASSDDRRLGVAVSGIRLTPVAGGEASEA